MIKAYLSKYQDDFNNCINDLKNIKTWYKLIPNLLTISRPIGMIPANILFFTGNVIPAVVLTGVLLLTDLFDGKLARKWNVQSKLGADLDAVGDKIMFLGMALPLLVSSPVMIVNILFEGIIALVNVIGRIKGLDTKTVYSGKVKTWFLSLTLGIGYLVQFFNVPISILQVLVALTSITQGIALSDYVGKYKEMEFHKKFNVVLDEYQDVTDNEIDEENNEIDKLKREREFMLGTIEPNKIYTGKKRVRKMVQKRNSL